MMAVGTGEEQSCLTHSDEVLGQASVGSEPPASLSLFLSFICGFLLALTRVSFAQLSTLALAKHNVSKGLILVFYSLVSK